MENISIKDFMTDQIKKWEDTDDKKGTINYPVVTIAREPGSGGTAVAEKVAHLLDYYYFHYDLLKGIAMSADVSEQVMRSIEKEHLTGIQDFISSLINKEYIWSGLYIEHLVRIVNVIAEHGRAVIVGRGANFILRPEDCFRIRIVAPLDLRIQNIARTHDVTKAEAEKRILEREARRKKFVKDAFNRNIENPANYDTVLNTEKLSRDKAAAIIIHAAKQ